MKKWQTVAIQLAHYDIAIVLILVTQFISVFSESTPRSMDSSTGSSEGSINQVRFQDPLCTIHSYEIEHSDSDSTGSKEPLDMEDDKESGKYMYDSKWSTWC